MATSTLSSQDVEVLRTIAREEWTRAGLARDWDKAISLCTNDVVYMVPDQPALRGRAALRAWLEQFPTIVKFTQEADEVEGHENLAVLRGTAEMTIESEGQSVQNTSKWLCHMQKQPDGAWQASAVCFNWDKPMPSA